MQQVRPADRARLVCAAFTRGQLGGLDIPEDIHPDFGDQGRADLLAYYTLPMSLNYQRSSQAMWLSARETYGDPQVAWVFNEQLVTQRPAGALRDALTRHKLAIQPTRHIINWGTVAATLWTYWGGMAGLLNACNYDFVRLRRLVQVEHKREFPYLSGPKLFNYWAYILVTRCGIDLANAQLIDIAVDTHVAKASVKLGLIDSAALDRLDRVEIAARWRAALLGSGLRPMDLNVPLWKWSRAGFPPLDGLPLD